MKVEFDQICALVVFLVCAALVWFKVDSEVKSVMTLSAGYLVGSGVVGRKKPKGG